MFDIEYLNLNLSILVISFFLVISLFLTESFSTISLLLFPVILSVTILLVIEILSYNFFKRLLILLVASGNFSLFFSLLFLSVS